MMQPRLEHIQEKLGTLTPDRLAEVEDFIDFLHQRDQEKQLRKSYSHASEEVFHKVWDNDDDAIYDRL